MDPRSSSSARHAVTGAFAVLLRNISTFGMLALGWTTISAAAMLVMPSAHKFVVGSFRQMTVLDGAVADGAFLLATVASVVVFLVPAFAASVLIPVAAHRLVVLRERPRIAPAGILALAVYAARLATVSAPTIVLAFLMTAAGDMADDGWIDAGYSILSSVAYAATVRWQLALVATAVGRDDLAFAKSWIVTRRNTFKLFAGFLACVLPFDMLVLAFDQVAPTPEIGTATFAASTALSTFLYLLAGVVTAAYLSFAYLHFVGDDPNRGDVSSHFH
jgi:hypothetical protein